MSSGWRTDAIAHLRFLTNDEGGRKTDIEPVDEYRTVLSVPRLNENYSCRLKLDRQVIRLGNEYDIEIQFLHEDAFKEIRPEDVVALWEGSNIALGNVLSVISSAN